MRRRVRQSRRAARRFRTGFALSRATFCALNLALYLMRLCRFSGVLFLAFGTPLLGQTVSLGINRDAGPVRIQVNGEAGFDYRLEGGPAIPQAGEWDFVATLRLDGSSQSWLDAQSGVLPTRLYRASRSALAPPEPAEDFRLIDHLGRSDWLFYYLGMPSVHAVVLVFTGNGCVAVRDLVPTIKTLTARFSRQGVVLWLVDSNAGDNRSNILAEATTIGLSSGPPILHDAAQLVAQTYRATVTPEAVAIDRGGFAASIFYRGAIDDRLGSSAVASTQHYLSNALSRFLAGANISPRETRATGCAIVLNPPSPNVSYADDIAPLLQAKCVRCHSPGNIAPWAMTNYESVQINAPDRKSTR